MDVKLSLLNSEYKELTDYCNLNDLLISEVVKKSYKSGFNIERYGLLNGSQPTNEVVKEVIKEVPVQVIVEKKVEVIKEVPVEVIVEKTVEVIKEVPVEKIVEIIKEVPLPPIETKVIEYVDKEVVREVPVEKIVTKIEYICDNTQTNELLLKIQQLEQREPEKIEVIKEVPVEIVKEVIVEKMVGDESKQKMLEQTLQTLRSDLINRDKKIKELEEIIQSFEKYKHNVGAVYLRGSNLDETLFKQ